MEISEAILDCTLKRAFICKSKWVSSSVDSLGDVNDNWVLPHKKKWCLML